MNSSFKIKRSLLDYSQCLIFCYIFIIHPIFHYIKNIVVTNEILFNSLTKWMIMAMHLIVDKKIRQNFLIFTFLFNNYIIFLH